MAIVLGLVGFTLIAGGFPSVLAQSTSIAANPTASLQVSITVSPSTVSAGSPVTFSAQVSNSGPPFTYAWNNVPSGCNPQPQQSWQCTINSGGQYSISVTVTNGTGVQGTASSSFTVTSNNGNGNGGNGNGNGGGSNGNSSNGFNLSSFGPFLFYGLIAGLVGFALLVILTVAVVMIAVTLSRRLPRPPKGGIECGSCHAVAPAGSKFCPACAAPLGPKKV